MSSSSSSSVVRVLAALLPPMLLAVAVLPVVGAAQERIGRRGLGGEYEGACAGYHQDPFANGVEIRCCATLTKCLGNWTGPDQSYWCVECYECDGQLCDDPVEWVPPEPPRSDASTKRGIAVKEVTKSNLRTLRNAVSWGYTWEAAPTYATLGDWDRNGIEYIPMVWGSAAVENDLNKIPTESTALLGFNEPNFVEQANLQPDKAAELWPQLEIAADAKGIPLLISPAVNVSPDEWQGVEWLREFFHQCDLKHTNGCQVDAIAVHSYVCQVSSLDYEISQYHEFNKTIWLTEFACHVDDYRKNATGQFAYMLEAVPYLEANPAIDLYAWFSYDDFSAEAALFTDEGLTELGKLYKELEGDPYYGSPTLSPSPTVYPTRAPTATPTSSASRNSNWVSETGALAMGSVALALFTFMM